MEYHYISELTTKQPKSQTHIPIICYHVNTETSTPFLQILLEKNGYNELTLPSLHINNTDESDINEGIIDRVYNTLLCCPDIKCSKDNILLDGFSNLGIAFVNISSIDINYFSQTLDDCVWFVLISEIVNTNCVCDSIRISSDTINIFCSNKKHCLLYKNETNTEFYNIPDPCYTLDEIKRSQFKLIFGQTPDKENNYYFYTSLERCLSSTVNENHEKFGLNRYAIFYNEENSNINNNNNYDIKLTKYDEFYPLSHHGTFIKKNTGKRELL
jgi:hypothetical protein